MATTTLPPTMKAWAYSETGPHRQVLSQIELPTPSPPTGDQVLVKVTHATLQFGDLKRMNQIPAFLQRANTIPGQDYAGTIVARGPLAPPHLALGTKVFGMLAGTGSLCEYIVLSASSGAVIVPVPAGWAVEDAASVMIGGLMALLICKKCGIEGECGMRMLVHGASGGCGTAFVQVAKAMGAKEVVATCSTPNFELIEGLGADVTIDYRKQAPLHEHLAKQYGENKFDIVVDMVGAQELYINSLVFLKEGCVYVNIGDYTNGLWTTLLNWFLNTYWPELLGGTPRKFIMFGPWGATKLVDQLTTLMADGKIKPVIEKSVSFDQVLEGYDVVATKRVRGRVMVRVSGD